MPHDDLALKAAHAARFQRRHGDASPMRLLFHRAFSFLRFYHHRHAA